MALLSMTGFGEADGGADKVRILVEVKTVNSRYLDINCRLPQAYNRLEQNVLRIVRSSLKRGRVDLFVTRTKEHGESEEISFNEELFSALLAVMKKGVEASGVKEKEVLPGLVRDILSRREIVSYGVEDAVSDEEVEALEKIVQIALDKLIAMRRTEGEALEKELRSQLKTLQDIAARISKLASSTAAQFQERLKMRLEKLSPAVQVEPERLAQEVAILADRVDITEELVRLKSHTQQFQSVLAEGESGKKLEFLLQELGREINTIGSKSQNSEVTVLVVEAKAVLEKMREQVLNIE